jgi:hypothetical protein
VLNDPIPQLAAAPILEAALILAVVAFVVVWAVRSDDLGNRLELLVGATAGLEFGQIANVHLFTIACGLYVLFGRTEPRGQRWLPATVVLVAAAALLSATVWTGDLVNTRGTGLQLFALALSAGAVATKTDLPGTRRMAYGLLGMTTFGAAIAVGQRTGIVPYTPFADPNQLGRVKGIWHEPDWLGMYSAIGLVLAFRLRMDSRIHALVVSVLAAGLVLSLARAAWIALVLVLLASLLTTWWHGPRSAESTRRNVKVAAFVAAGAVVVLALSPAFRTTIGERLGAILGTRGPDISVVARQAQNRALTTLEDSAPWYGHGLSSAGRISVSGRIEYGNAPNNVASNWLLGWWIDGKFLAIPLILALLGIAIAGVGTTGGALLLLTLTASLASNATLVPIVWMAAGMALAELSGQRRPFASPSSQRKPRAGVTPDGSTSGHVPPAGSAAPAS